MDDIYDYYQAYETAILYLSHVVPSLVIMPDDENILFAHGRGAISRASHISTTPSLVDRKRAFHENFVCECLVIPDKKNFYSKFFINVRYNFFLHKVVTLILKRY